jgi:hypothetical protein
MKNEAGPGRFGTHIANGQKFRRDFVFVSPEPWPMI